jgi:hypothetical protein
LSLPPGRAPCFLAFLKFGRRAANPHPDPLPE